MALPLAAGAAGAGIIGGVLGNILSADDREAAMAALQNAKDIIAGVKVPTPEELAVTYNTLQQQGILTPELEEAFKQKDSELKGITIDQGLKDSQKLALQSLADLGRTGLNAEDRAALVQIRNQTAQQEKAANDAILQNMAARGMGGSGTELAARLAATQNSASNAETAGLNQAAQAQARALQAIQQQGQLASQIRGQEFGEQSDIAKAQDVINQFNTANQQGVQSRNVGAKNVAQGQNLSEKQRVADTNVGLYNKQQDIKRQNQLDVYNMNMQKAMGMAGMAQPIANQYMNQAQATANMWSGIGGGVGQGMAGVQSQNNFQDYMSKAYPSGAPAGYGGKYEGGMITKEDLPEEEMPEYTSDKNIKWEPLEEDEKYSQGGNVHIPRNMLQQAHGGPVSEDTSLLKHMMAQKAKNMKQGGKVPGKSNVPGDSPKNDTVPAMLSPGEYVMPRSKVEKAKKVHDSKSAAKFVAEILGHMAKNHSK